MSRPIRLDCEIPRDGRRSVQLSVPDSYPRSTSAPRTHANKNPSHSRTASGTHDPTRAQPSQKLDTSSKPYREPELQMNSTVGKFFEVKQIPPIVLKHEVSYFELGNHKKEVKRGSLIRQLMKELLDNHLNKNDEFRAIPDGQRLIFSMKPLDDVDLKAVPSEKLYNMILATGKAQEKTQFQVRVRRLPNVDLENVRQCTKGAECGGVECPVKESIEALNVLIQAYASQNQDWVRVHKNIYFPKSKIDNCPEAHRIHLRRGISFSIDLIGENCRSTYEAREHNTTHHALNLKVSVCATPFLDAGNLAEFVLSYFGASGEICVTKQIKNQREKTMANILNGLLVHQTYESPADGKASAKRLPENMIPEQGKERRIAHLGKSAKTQTFNKSGEAEETSVQNHFNKIGLGIKNPDLPVANTGSKQKPVWIPLEYLWVAPHQPIFKYPAPKDAKDSQFKAFVEKEVELKREFAFSLYNRNDPAVKLLNQDRLLNDFDIILSKQPENLKGRFLPASPDELAERVGQLDINNKTAWKFPGKRGLLRKAHFVVFEPDPDSIEADFGRLCQKFAQVLQRDGDNQPNSVAMETTFHIVSCKDCLPKTISSDSFSLPDWNAREDLLFVGLSGTKSERENAYARVVMWSDIRDGTPVTFFNTEEFMKRMEILPSTWSYAQKQEKAAISYARALITKAVMKVDGPSAHVYHLEDLNDGILSKTMIVAASLIPGKMKFKQADRNDPSIAAVVASTTDQFNKYCGSTRVQGPGRKIIADLRGMMEELLRRYARDHHELPHSVLYYRDNVGEDNFDMVKSAETLQIVDAYEAVLSNNSALELSEDGPKISIVALSRNTNTKFFPHKLSTNGSGKRENFAGGFTVDSIEFQKTSAKARQFDFHLQSHTNSKDEHCGFASNTHYFVLKNEMKLSREDVQRLTYRLCHINPLMPEAASCIEPANYSGKLCERGRIYLRNAVESLKRSHKDLSTEMTRDPDEAIKNIQNQWPNHNRRSPDERTLRDNLEDMYWL